MERQIKINFAEIYTKTAQMRSRLQVQQYEMESEYKRIQANIMQNTDGAASAALCEALEANEKKACEVAETIDKLISFMINAAKAIEAEDRKISNVFDSAVLQSSMDKE